MPGSGKFSPPLQIAAQTRLAGVDYALFTAAGKSWRVASPNPAWRVLVSDVLAGKARNDLEAGQVWLAEDGKPPALAVMCCGLGSAWPGMGRELYSNFSVARQAMEQVALLADWDILTLLDEPDLERISRTRWQIPYLFMLEYAQWQVFQALGMKPQLICGHSLGELIALCLAGVYSLQSAWYLLEIRAEHMAGLEARGCHQGGMLAVPAGMEEIAAILEQWPDLHISNRNTERQFVLSGKREELLLARKQLRRKRIPAIMLNMNLAFHNPGMRILRNMSLRRLNGLKMASPACPVLSCVDASPYPASQPEICTRIADLDENTVDWVRLVESILQNCPNAAFLELGPQETLCGLTGELAPNSLCIAADSRNRESVAMRIACARLFAAGFLDFAAIHSLAQKEPGDVLPVPPAPSGTQQGRDLPFAGDALRIVQLLAQACARPVAAITPQMDLRQDLAIRSSQFPWLMLEAERELGHPVVLENLFHLVTVADLIRFLIGPVDEKEPEWCRNEPRKSWLQSRRVLRRFSLVAGRLAAAPFAPGVSESSTRPCILRKFQTSDKFWAKKIEEWFARVAVLPLAAAGEKPRAIAWLCDRDAPNPGIITDCLALEQRFGHEDAIVWRVPEDGRNLPLFRLDSPLYGEVFPAPEAAGFSGDVVRLLRHFSLFTEPGLGAHGKNGLFTPLAQYETASAFVGAAWLPLGQLLQTMTLAATVAVPWLMPIGFTDLRIFRLFALPEGITRECSIAATARLSLFQDGTPVRLCRVGIDVAQLSGTGRKLANWLPVSEGTIFLAREFAPFPPIWPGRFLTGSGVAVDLENFYAAVGFASDWQLLQNLETGFVRPGWRATLTIPAANQSPFLLADACLQGTMLALAMRHAANGTRAALAHGLSLWRFAAIGFIRFDANVCAHATRLDMEWAISWEDDWLTRFDVQILAEDGTLAMTVHNMEFDRVAQQA